MIDVGIVNQYYSVCVCIYMYTTLWHKDDYFRCVLKLRNMFYLQIFCIYSQYYLTISIPYLFFCIIFP